MKGNGTPACRTMSSTGRRDLSKIGKGQLGIVGGAMAAVPRGSGAVFRPAVLGARWFTGYVVVVARGGIFSGPRFDAAPPPFRRRQPRRKFVLHDDRPPT